MPTRSGKETRFGLPGRFLRAMENIWLFRLPPSRAMFGWRNTSEAFLTCGNLHEVLSPKGARLPPRERLHIRQSLIPHCPVQHVRGGPANRGTAPAGTEDQTPGTALSSIG